MYLGGRRGTFWEFIGAFTGGGDLGGFSVHFWELFYAFGVGRGGWYMLGGGVRVHLGEVHFSGHFWQFWRVFRYGSIFWHVV